MGNGAGGKAPSKKCTWCRKGQVTMGLPQDAAADDEVNFVILRYLMAGPCRETAAVLAKEMQEKTLLPRSYNWKGEAVSMSFAELCQQHPLVQPSFLPRALAKLVPKSSYPVLSVLGPRHFGNDKCDCEEEHAPVRDVGMVTRSKRARSLVADPGMEQETRKVERPRKRPRAHKYKAKPACPSNILRLLEQRSSFGRELRAEQYSSATYRHIEHLKSLHGHRLRVGRAIFDKTSTILVTGADDNMIKLWDIRNGMLRHTLRNHDAEITDISVDASNSVIASASNDCTVRLWDILSGRPLKKFSGHKGAVNVVAFSPCPSRPFLISGGADGACRIYNMSNLDAHPTIVHVAKAHYRGSVQHGTSTSLRARGNGNPQQGGVNTQYGVENSNDLNNATNSATNGLTGDLQNGMGNAPRSNLAHSVVSGTPTFEVQYISFNRAGTQFVAGGTDSRARVYSISPGSSKDSAPIVTSLTTLRGHSSALHVLKFANTSNKILTASRDGTAKIWTPTGHHVYEEFTLRSKTPSSGKARAFSSIDVALLSRDDRWCVTASSDKKIRVWDANEGELVHLLSGHEKETYVLKSHPWDSRIVMSASYDGSLRIWDIVQGLCIKRVSFDGTSSPLVDGNFAPNGFFIAAAGTNGKTHVCGTGAAESLRHAPEEQFFREDFALHEPGVPHHNLATRSVLCNEDLQPYGEELQNRLSPTELYSDELREGAIRLAHRFRQQEAANERILAERKTLRMLRLRPNTFVVADDVEVVQDTTPRGPEEKLAVDNGSEAEDEERVKELHANAASSSDSDSDSDSYYSSAEDVLRGNRRTLSMHSNYSDLSPGKHVTSTDLGQHQGVQPSHRRSVYYYDQEISPANDRGGRDPSFSSEQHHVPADNASFKRTFGTSPTYCVEESASPVYSLRSNLRGAQGRKPEGADHDTAFGNNNNVRNNTDVMVNIDDISRQELKDLERLQGKRKISREQRKREKYEKWNANDPRLALAGNRAKFPLAASDWLRASHGSTCAYIPQIGDAVYYFPKGHREVIKCWESVGLDALGTPDGDRVSNYLRGEGDSMSLFTITGIHYRFPQRTNQKRTTSRRSAKSNRALRIIAVLKLSGQEGTFFLNYFPVDEVPEYLVLRQRVDRATVAKWRVGDRFRMLFLIQDKRWDYYSGKILRVKPNIRSEPWNSIQVQWDNEGVDFVSPWELERAGAYEPPPVQSERDAQYYRRMIRKIEELGASDATWQARIEFFLVSVASLSTIISYTSVVPCPIDLHILMKRMHSGFYRRPSAVMNDFALLKANALLFNKPGSEVAEAAKAVYAKVAEISNAVTSEVNYLQEFGSFPGLGSGASAYITSLTTPNGVANLPGSSNFGSHSPKTSLAPQVQRVISTASPRSSRVPQIRLPMRNSAASNNYKGRQLSPLLPQVVPRTTVYTGIQPPQLIARPASQQRRFRSSPGPSVPNHGSTPMNVVTMAQSGLVSSPGLHFDNILGATGQSTAEREALSCGSAEAAGGGVHGFTSVTKAAGYMQQRGTSGAVYANSGSENPGTANNAHTSGFSAATVATFLPVSHLPPQEHSVISRGAAESTISYGGDNLPTTTQSVDESARA